MLGSKSIAETKSSTTHAAATYTTGADFCRIFQTDMNRLYLLAYMLTADHATAEQCFVAGLEDSHKSNNVFREWAESWARRTIISNAIRIVRPQPAAHAHAMDHHPAQSIANQPMGSDFAVPDEAAGILSLPTFERFAFVMRVLEGYSDRECCLLLECTASDLSAARIHAFQQIATTANHQTKRADAESSDEDAALKNKTSMQPKIATRSMFSAPTPMAATA